MHCFGAYSKRGGIILHFIHKKHSDWFWENVSINERQSTIDRDAGLSVARR